VLKVVILAKDGGSPVKTGVLTLNVTVQDVNDNAPIFTASHYNVSINESVPRDTVIAQIHANDKDVGLNAEVRCKQRVSEEGFQKRTLHLCWCLFQHSSTVEC
jgi:hypothetical protein